MTVILHIESATKPCSVALSKGEELLFFRMNDQAYSHSVQLGLFVDEALSFAGQQGLPLDAVSVSGGPGSYTGLRIGVSMAKGICYGYGIPLIAISTLRILAGQVVGEADENTLLCPALDARRMEIYTAVYDHQGKELLPAGAVVLEENSFEELFPEKTLCFFGDGAKKCTEKLRRASVCSRGALVPRAREMVLPALEAFRSGRFEKTAYFEPNYLKEFQATVPRKLDRLIGKIDSKA
ncbi:MAG: tRNA (adenosine(37)-N6)-threonylcarbamoyltransferase complex dimerization subunit type 1 TsaB [Bacteroidales bacterium]|nr:tRNA (adenosine(37)-N6)-threonylcarbamoyltransferase complex dimerization subunit type 1 TsaB [Bacteroidales bacterium]